MRIPGWRLSLSALIVLTATACTDRVASAAPEKAAPKSPSGRTETAVFAGGCFWCMQPPFDKLDGVLSTTVGFTGGKKKNPTYKEVAYGRTQHTEAIQVVFDPKRISYARLLDVFWRNIDPTDANGQFVDRGKQYRPGIFYASAAQKRLALKSRDALAKSRRFTKPIATEVTRLEAFYAAEDYHQKFYKKNPPRYYSYRAGSGRDAFLRRVWK